MPFGYLEFSRAKRRELCPHMQACARAAAAAAGRPTPAPVPGLGLGSGSGSGSLPGLVLFESGLAGMGCSAPLPKPPARQRIRTARQRMSENRLDGWTVVQLGGCDGSVRTVATIEIWRTRKPLPERYK